MLPVRMFDRSESCEASISIRMIIWTVMLLCAFGVRRLISALHSDALRFIIADKLLFTFPSPRNQK